MLIIRRYKKLGWFDLLDKISEELGQNPPKESYFRFLDEFRMRLIESVSEGATYKLKGPTQDLLEGFKERRANDSAFASEEEVKEFELLAKDIL